MSIQVIVRGAAQPTGGILNQPILLAAIITFSGVLITVIVGTIVNFQLAKRRNEFEKNLNTQRFENEKHIAEQKLADEKEARVDTRSRELDLRRIDFQRQNLLSLQEAVHGLINITNTIFNIASRNIDDDESWADAIRGTKKSSEMSMHYNRVALYEFRSASDEVREQSKKIRTECSLVRKADTEEAARKENSSVKAKYVPFLRLTGQLIRELDNNVITQP